MQLWSVLRSTGCSPGQTLKVVAAAWVLWAPAFPKGKQGWQQLVASSGPISSCSRVLMCSNNHSPQVKAQRQQTSCLSKDSQLRT